MKRFCVSLATILALAYAAVAENPSLLDSNTIKVVQEREARERAVARRIEYQIAKQPQPAPVPAPPQRTLSSEEQRQLRDAVDRYIRNKPGRVPVLWTPPAR
jgi:hypothetical protein